MNGRNPCIDARLPYWSDYRKLIGRLPQDTFPDTGVLNKLLPGGAANFNGQPIQFVPASLLGAMPYEKHIFETGQVSTRENNWHDLFNALVWCRLPRLKMAMNAMHYEKLHEEQSGRRGRLRDALTLLDESGVLLVGSNRRVLQALAARDWERTFLEQRDAWRDELRVIVCGHALLEKFLNPYKALTAHALLLLLDEEIPLSPGDLDLSVLDAAVSGDLLSGGLLNSSRSLTPLPLMGIPGWARQQDQAFYQDRDVFRPARKIQGLAPVNPIRFSS
jgi:hypothetical protein